MRDTHLKKYILDILKISMWQIIIYLVRKLRLF